MKFTSYKYDILQSHSREYHYESILLAREVCSSCTLGSRWREAAPIDSKAAFFLLLLFDPTSRKLEERRRQEAEANRQDAPYVKW